MILGTIVAIIGAVTGVSGLTLSIVKRIRDNPKVILHLQFDMNVLNPDDTSNSENKIGAIRVVNAGRRPVFFSHAAAL
jgi:hypothetical protein